MSITTRPRPVKSLQEQQSDRMRRAEEQRICYRIKWVGCRITDSAGRTHTELVATVTKRREYLRAGERQVSYFVTACGCNCEDAKHARAAGIKRSCKHELMAAEDFTRLMMQDEDPEPVYVPDEVKAEETLAAVEVARREAFKRRMQEDFPAE